VARPMRGLQGSAMIAVEEDALVTCIRRRFVEMADVQCCRASLADARTIVHGIEAGAIENARLRTDGTRPNSERRTGRVFSKEAGEGNRRT
jgi:hypothetical protein